MCSRRCGHGWRRRGCRAHRARFAHRAHPSYRANLARPARPHLPRGQIDDGGAVAQGGQSKKRPAHQELNVIGMRTEGKHIDLHDRGMLVVRGAASQDERRDSPVEAIPPPSFQSMVRSTSVLALRPRLELEMRRVTR